MISVAVIGGGISGLSAAYRLRQQGARVTLFEASARVGGVIQSERDNGFLVEHGPSSIEGLDADTAELIESLGIAQLRVEARPAAKKLLIVRRGKALAVPTSAAQFLTSPLFSPLCKLRLLQEPFIKRGDVRHEESIAAFASRRLGREFFHYIVSPFVTSVLAGNPTRLSARHAFARLYQAEQRYGSLTRGFLAQARARKHQGTPATDTRLVFSFQQGLQTLTDALATQLQEQVQLNTPVSNLRLASGEWIVTTRRAGQPGLHTFDAVILTTPLHKIPDIAGVSADDLCTFSALEYPPLALVALGFRRTQVAHALDGLGMLVPMIEGKQILGTLFSSTVYPERAPQGHVLLTTFIGGACQPELAQRPMDELLALTLRELETTLGITGQPVFRKHIYLEHSLPQYQPGHQRLLERIEQLENQLPGLFLAGNYRQGVSARDALHSGYAAAERLTSAMNLRLVNEPAG